MSNKFNELSFELYAKNTDKRVLAEGPSNAKFWAKKSLKRRKIKNDDENSVLCEMRQFIQEELCLGPQADFSVHRVYYSCTSIRLSAWAWVLTAEDCYKCHAEAVNVKEERMTVNRLSTYAFPPDGVMCYYYTFSLENAIDILQHWHLFGSFPSKVNDPNDMRIQVVGLERNGNIPMASRIATGVNCEIDKKKLLDRSYRFVCFADAEMVDANSDTQCYFWTNYAGGFRGVRFKFCIDSTFLLTPSPQDAFFDKITYDDTIHPTLDLSGIKSGADINSAVDDPKFLQDLCFSKSRKWAHEVEWRVGSTVSRLSLEMSQIQSREERFFQFNPKNLKEIVIGSEALRTDKVKALTVAAFAMSHGVVARRLTNCLLAVDFDKDQILKCSAAMKVAAECSFRTTRRK
jgi:hypothetical protein